MNIQTAKISELHADPNNARKHSKKNIDTIKASLSRFGQQKPIVVRGDTVIAGNGTLAAAFELNWDTIDIVRVPEEWDDATAKAYALADNKTAELAEWDSNVLIAQLTELAAEGLELEDLGFVIPNLDDAPRLDADIEDVPVNYGIVVECQTESEQAVLLERFILEGLRVRALM